MTSIYISRQISEFFIITFNPNIHHYPSDSCSREHSRNKGNGYSCAYY